MNTRKALIHRFIASVGLFGLTASINAALAQSAANLPAPLREGNIEYITGGIGHDHAIAMRDAAHSWPLSLGFFGTQGEYLAGVQVEISDSGGRRLFRAASTGPYMLIKLQPGIYRVTARYEGRTTQRAVTISEDKTETATFEF